MYHKTGRSGKKFGVKKISRDFQSLGWQKTIHIKRKLAQHMQLRYVSSDRYRKILRLQTLNSDEDFMRFSTKICRDTVR